MTKRSWDMLSDDRRRECEQALIDVLGREYDLEIGVITAGAILDHFLQTAGVDAYNKGVEDARNLVRGAAENVDFDMGSLQRS